MGRPRKPLAGQEANRRVHRSNDEKDARRESESRISGPSDKMDAPDYLSSELVGRFDEIVSLMKSIKGFPCSNLDVDSIARYVLEEDEYLAASNALRKARSDKMTHSAEMEKLQRMKNSAFKCVDTSAKSLGLTIDSRLRFDIKKEDEKPQNRFEGLRNA